MKDFKVQREEVISYIKEGLKEQGANPAEISMAVTRIYFWGSKDVENLHKCINSDLPALTIKEIVAHDFNGLSNNKECFLPKSSQFGV